jgi:hypothetical protein
MGKGGNVICRGDEGPQTGAAKDQSAIQPNFRWTLMLSWVDDGLDGRNGEEGLETGNRLGT